MRYYFVEYNNSNKILECCREVIIDSIIENSGHGLVNVNKLGVENEGYTFTHNTRILKKYFFNLIDMEFHVGNLATCIVKFDYPLELTPFEISAYLHFLSLPKQPGLYIMEKETDIFSRLYLILSADGYYKDLREKEFDLIGYVDTNIGIYINGPSTLTRYLLSVSNYFREALEDLLQHNRIKIDVETIINTLPYSYPLEFDNMQIKLVERKE